jgi:predicted CXXCH cytochrome family protein
MGGKVKHPAVEQVGCPFCHSPHSAGEERLLQMPLPDLCVACHGDIPHIKDMVGAKLVCTQCHSPHSTQEAKLLK